MLRKYIFLNLNYTLPLLNVENNLNIQLLKLLEIEILRVYYTIPFGFSLFLVLFGHYFSAF